jgi:hypothetical protein
MRKQRRVPEWRRPHGCICVSELAEALGEDYWKVWSKLRRLDVPYEKRDGMLWIRVKDAERFAQQVFGKEVSLSCLLTEKDDDTNGD